jgi:hypothetical protein
LKSKAGAAGAVRAEVVALRCSPRTLSSPRVVLTEASGASVGLAEPADTVRLRGSQKSMSCSDETERAYGAGEGDREGHDDMRSLVVLQKEAEVFSCDGR